jgi:hypothetical protein
MTFAAAVQRTHNATELDRRRRWTSTGTSLGTAARMEQIVDRMVGVVLSLHPTNPGVLEVPTELPVADTFGTA